MMLGPRPWVLVPPFHHHLKDNGPWRPQARGDTSNGLMGRLGLDLSLLYPDFWSLNVTLHYGPVVTRATEQTPGQGGETPGQGVPSPTHTPQNLQQPAGRGRRAGHCREGGSEQGGQPIVRLFHFFLQRKPSFFLTGAQRHYRVCEEGRTQSFWGPPPATSRLTDTHTTAASGLGGGGKQKKWQQDSPHPMQSWGQFLQSLPVISLRP